MNVDEIVYLYNLLQENLRVKELEYKTALEARNAFGDDMGSDEYIKLDAERKRTFDAFSEATRVFVSFKTAQLIGT